MQTKQLNAGFILSYAAIIIQSLISVIYTPVMLRLLGQSSYGLLQLALSAVSVLGILSFGFSGSYLRFYSKYKAADNTRAIASLNGMFAVIFAAVSALAAGAGSIIAVNAEKIFSQSMTFDELACLKTLLGIMTANLAVSFLCSVFDSYIISQERFIFQKLLVIATALLNPMLTFPLLLAGKGPVSVSLCMTLITFIRFAASSFFCIKKLGMKFMFSFDSAVFRQLSMFSFFVFLNIVSDQINWNVDKTLLGIFKNPQSVTVYSVSSQFNSYFLTFSYALSSVLSPKAYDLVANNKDSKLISRFFARYGRIQFPVMSYIYMAFLAVGEQFIKIWSGLDTPVPYYTALILITPLLVTSAQSIGIEIQRAKDMHRFRSVLYAMIAAGNILLSIPLCMKFGEIGCAAGTCACLILGNIIIMNIYYHKKVGIDIPYFWEQIFKFIPSLILPAAAVIVIKSLVTGSIVSVIAGAAAFTVIYWVSMYFLGFNNKEKNYILSVIKTRRKKS